MKKTLKVFFCTLLIVTVLTAQVCASGWAEYSPDYADTAELLFAENVNSTQSAETMKNIVENAYNLGLFGGAVPIAVTRDKLSNTSFFVKVICMAPVIVNESGTNPPKESTYGSINVQPEVTTIEATEGMQYLSYLLVNNGDYLFATTEAEQYTMGLDEKVLLIKDQNEGWYYNSGSSTFAQFNNTDTTENAGLTYINEVYTLAYTPPAPPVYVEYILDIPSIITAIPNGAKQIINNTFGFEIFGINVAGLLSVIIIVALVAWGAKKLTTR